MGNVVAVLSAIGGWVGQNLVAVVGWLVAIAVAGWAVRKASTANQLAKKANEHADEANRLAREANEISVSTSDIARQQVHRDLRPPAMPPVEVDVEPGVGGRQAGLFATISFPRDYRVVIDALDGQSTRRLPVGPFVAGGQPTRIHVEHWPQGKDHPVTKHLRFRFWPPDTSDATDPWTCPCGRPTNADYGQVGHWEMTVPISYYNVLDSIH